MATFCVFLKGGACCSKGELFLILYLHSKVKNRDDALIDVKTISITKDCTKRYIAQRWIH